MTDLKNSAPETPQDKVTVAAKIHEIVAQRLEKSKGDVREAVIESFVSKENDRRASLLIKAVNKAEELEKAIAKIKPDQHNYDGNGDLLSSTFSEQKMKELKKVKQERAKLDQAMDEAFDSANYQQLEKALK